MKKIFFLAVLLPVGVMYGQKVGINTNTPKTTLEVISGSDISHQSGVLAPRLTRAELTIKGENLYGEEHKGALIYVTDILGGDAEGQRVEIVEPGYYVFDGNIWQRVIKTSEYLNLYKGDGELASNRTVTQGDKTLTFSTSTLGGTVFRNTIGTEAAQKSAVQIIDGEQGVSKVLMSDAYGNGTWQEPAAPVLTGSFADSGRVGVIDAVGVSYKTGASITLPPGKWAVSISVEMNMLKPDDVTKHGGGSRWGVLFLSTRTEDTLSVPSGLPTIKNTAWLAANNLYTVFEKQKLAGTQIIEVDGSVSQTFNVYFTSNEGWGAAIDSNFNATGYRFVDSFKASGKNTYLFAVKLK